MNSLELVPQIVKDITGKVIMFKFDDKAKNNEATHTITIQNEEPNLDIKFITFTWNTKKEAKKADQNYKNIPNNLFVISKESLTFIPTLKTNLSK